MKKKGLALMLTLSLLSGTVLGSFPALKTHAAESSENNKIIEESDIPLRLYYDEEAAHGIDTDFETKEVAGVLGDNSAIKNADDDWENWSIPIGNGHFGANVFGRTETERIQITEKTLANPYGSWDTSKGGLNNFSETYIDLGHTNSSVSNYSRELDFKTAVSTVNYTFNSVNYSREYFTSYPDKAIIIKLTADTAGALDFTLRPTIPYEQSYAQKAGDGVTKTGTVTSSVENGVGTIELTGKLGYYDVDFMGLYRVYTDGNMTASTTDHTWTDRDGTKYTDTDGTIVVEGANCAYIVITLGTDYVLSSETFTAPDNAKPTFKTDLDDTRAKVESEMNALCAKINPSSAATLESSYQVIKASHVADYSELFGRVSLDLNCNPEDFNTTTDVLVSEYRSGENISTYLEVLLFQYGRYLLIASSREGALPSNLQGVWNRYNFTPWSGGFWHNVNIQMNYWPAFSTNLAEMFQPYVDFSEAYMPQLKAQANKLINANNPSASGADGGNGWTIGVGGMPFSILGQRSPGHLGFTTQMFYDYYAFTKDESILEDMFTIFADAARYITKTVIEDEDGNLLVEECESPEQYVNGSLYFTDGTTYTQSFIYENNYNLLRLAKEMGIDLDNIDSSNLAADDKAILKTVLAQIDRYDPIVIGYSGQIKEFREEIYYGDLGAAQYVHISQLVGLYPATIINNSTPAWQDAARVSLAGRGLNTEGWGYAHRINAYARLGEGEMAHTMLHNQIRDSIGNNLWSHYFVYQIDGNCGATAGVSEMLLQSHEGYIAPLAAIPELWADGSYTGLVARGNFVVSAEWANGLAKTFNITSQSGGTASVSYPGISKARVKTANGDNVAFTVVSKNLISFETEVGETYIIYGFEAEESIDAPATLALSSPSLGNFKLACTEVDGAIGYKLYTAVESAATYTLVATSEDGCFDYAAAKGEENVRTTFAVTAVNASGTESKRTLAYYLPTESTTGIKDTVGNILESGKLQVTVKSTGSVEKYKLYTSPKSGGDMTLVCESTYPIITVQEYIQDNYYYVSVVNSDTDEESEKTLINKFGSSSSNSYNASNIFAGKSFAAGNLATATHTGTHNGVSVPYDYSKLTDGSTHYQTGRFSTVSSSATQALDGIIDLGGGYILNELQIYDFNASATAANFMGSALEIQVYSLGEWTTVLNLESNSEILSHRVGTTYLSFDLGGIRAEKVRLYIPSRYLTNTISISEIKCSGILDPASYSYSDNLLLGKAFVPTAQAQNEIHIDAAGIDYGYKVLTDGSFAAKGGRFSTKNSSSSQMVDATIDLGGSATLKTLTLCAFAAANTGANLTIETYSDGEWTTAVSLSSYEEIQEYASTLPTGAAGVAYSFDLDGIQAEKIRIYISKNHTTTISFYEIMCSGYFTASGEEFGDRTSILSPTVQLVPESGCAGMVHNASMAYDKLTDGVYDNSGRYSSSKGTTVYFDATASLGNRYKLNEIRLYDFAANTASFNTDPSYAGKDLLVQVLSDGVWVTVIECTQAEYASHRVGGISGILGSAYLSFDLGGIIGEKVRVYNSGMYGSYTISYFEIELIGAICIGEGASNGENIFAEFDGAKCDKDTDASHPLSNLFDGDANTYTVVANNNGSYTVTLEFGEIKTCRELKIYEHIGDNNLIDGIKATASDATKIEVYRDGMWLTIYNETTLGVGLYTGFDMYNISCEKVRITFANTRIFDGESELRAAEIAEISCTTSSKPVDRTDLIDAYMALNNADVTDAFGLAEMKEAKLRELGALIMDTSANQATIDEYTERINSAKKKLTTLTPEADLVTGNYGDFSSYNCKLSGSIGFNFYAELNDGIEELFPDAFVVIEYVKYQDSTATVIRETRQLSEIDTDSNGRYVLTIELPAAQMTDLVKLRLVFDGDHMGEYIEESIRSYSDKIIANENGDYTESDISLVRAMLNYGGCAQSYFGYNTENLANAGIDVSDIKTNITDGMFRTSGFELSDFTPTDWSLALKENVNIRIYFRTTNINNYFISVTRSNGSVYASHIKEIGDGLWRIEIDLDDAKNIDEIYTISIHELPTGAVRTIEVNAVQYLNKLLEGNSDSTELQKLAEAIKLYCSVANGYESC